MIEMSTKAVWFRQDLRVDDHPALASACKENVHPVRGLVFISEGQWEKHNVGRNARSAWLTALSALSDKLAKLNIPLDVYKVKNWQEIPHRIELWCKQYQVDELHFNIELPFDERQRDLAVTTRLAEQIKVVRHRPDTILPPWQILNGQAKPFRVFTPFSKKVRLVINSASVNSIALCKVPLVRNAIQDKAGEQTALQQAIQKYSYDGTAPVTENEAHSQLNRFLKYDVETYERDRDYPALDATSNLSTALSVGSISIRRAYFLAHEFRLEDAFKWTTELLWRDFYRYIIWHFPTISQGKSFRNNVETHILWRTDEKQFEHWCQGQTGVPIVDAAMRQLNQTGWMHNRLRMVVASFLTKNLWIDWRLGEKYFADKLYDYDFASNNGGWQWCASVGVDAAPYFRVFSPLSQQQRFDKEAEFIRQWIPELSPYNPQQIHQFEKERFSSYCAPLVILKLSRKLAIEQFKIAVEQSQR